jgi:hypothetical protein
MTTNDGDDEPLVVRSGALGLGAALDADDDDTGATPSVHAVPHLSTAAGAAGATGGDSEADPPLLGRAARAVPSGGASPGRAAMADGDRNIAEAVPASTARTADTAREGPAANMGDMDGHGEAGHLLIAGAARATARGRTGCDGRREKAPDRVGTGIGREEGVRRP